MQHVSGGSWYFRGKPSRLRAEDLKEVGRGSRGGGHEMRGSAQIGECRKGGGSLHGVGVGEGSVESEKAGTGFKAKKKVIFCKCKPM